MRWCQSLQTSHQKSSYVNFGLASQCQKNGVWVKKQLIGVNQASKQLKTRVQLAASAEQEIEKPFEQ